MSEPHLHIPEVEALLDQLDRELGKLTRLSVRFSFTRDRALAFRHQLRELIDIAKENHP